MVAEPEIAASLGTRASGVSSHEAGEESRYQSNLRDFLSRMPQARAKTKAKDQRAHLGRVRNDVARILSLIHI
eukprot:13774501-Alexandrium_andersonii.AAC.1